MQLPGPARRGGATLPPDGWPRAARRRWTRPAAPRYSQIWYQQRSPCQHTAGFAHKQAEQHTELHQPRRVSSWYQHHCTADLSQRQAECHVRLHRAAATVANGWRVATRGLVLGSYVAAVGLGSPAAAQRRFAKRQRVPFARPQTIRGGRFRPAE